jgi:hypothetical protein
MNGLQRMTLLSIVLSFIIIIYAKPLDIHV